MTFSKVDYVILYVEDLDRSIAFYRDLVGLPFKFSESGYAEFATEGTKFALYARSNLLDLLGREGTTGGMAAEVAFLTSSVDDEAERIRGAGVTILAGPLDR